MAADIDPILVKALSLLHSKHPKALEQLRALRDEALGKKPEFIRERKKEEVKKDPIQVETLKKLPKPELITISSDSEGAGIVEDITDSSILVIEDDETDGVTETVEMGSSMIQSTDIPDEELMETVEELGLGYVEETLEELGSSNLLAKRKRPKLEINTDQSMNVFDAHDSSPEPEIVQVFEVSKCVVCSSGKSDSVGNQLVECHECHELYHQNCHIPHITDQSINDLRHVWYCFKCSKQMKQATSVTNTPKLKPISSPSFQATSKSLTQSFKARVRPEAKPPTFSPTSPSMNQSFVMPNLTSTVTGISSSNNGGLKSPGNANPRDVARHSMKRLQLVKKKAAKTHQRFAKR